MGHKHAGGKLVRRQITVYIMLVQKKNCTFLIPHIIPPLHVRTQTRDLNGAPTISRSTCLQQQVLLHARNASR